MVVTWKKLEIVGLDDNSELVIRLADLYAKVISGWISTIYGTKEALSILANKSNFAELQNTSSLKD